MAALWIRARHGVFRSFWFGNFQHGSAHVALDLERLGPFGDGGIVKGAAYVLGPTKRIGVFVRPHAHL